MGAILGVATSGPRNGLIASVSPTPASSALPDDQHHQHQRLAATAPCDQRQIHLFLGEISQRQRQAEHRQRRQRCGDEGHRHTVAQAAQRRHVARAGLMVDGADHQEQPRLVERMGDEIDHHGGQSRPRVPSPISSTRRPERGDRGLRQHLLEIGLAERPERAPEQRHPAEAAPASPSRAACRPETASSAPADRRRPAPWWPNAGTPKPASAPPWRWAARNGTETAPIW